MNENPNDQQEQPSLPSQVEQPPVQQPHVPLQAAPGFKLPIRPEDTGKKTLTRALIAGVVILVLAAVVGFFIYLRNSQSQPNSTDNLTKDTNTSFSTKSARAIVTELTAKVTSTQVKIVKANGYGGFDSSDKSVYNTTDYKVGDSRFTNYPMDSFGFGLQGTLEDINKDAEQISKVFASNNIPVLPSESDSTLMQYSDGGTFVTYATPKAVCHMAIEEPADSANSKATLGLGCADISDYSKVQESLVPFYTAYSSSEDALKSPEGLKYIRLGVPTVHSGQDSYKSAEISITSTKAIAGGSVGIFYKEPSKPWAYLQGTQELLSCDKFNTDTLKKSFAGQPCNDGKGGDNAVVTVDSNSTKTEEPKPSSTSSGENTGTQTPSTEAGKPPLNTTKN